MPGLNHANVFKTDILNSREMCNKVYHLRNPALQRWNIDTQLGKTFG